MITANYTIISKKTKSVVPLMPDHLSLKSGDGYVKEAGAAVLFRDMGVLQHTAEDEVKLKALILNLPVRWKWKVVNTYDSFCRNNIGSGYVTQ